MENRKNVFTRSAELGVPFGGMLLIASVAMIFNDKVPFLSLLTLLVAIAAPFVLYSLQRKRFIESNGFATFSELWTLAIFTTIGGAIICGCVTYVIITYLRPDFLYEQAQMIVDTYKKVPGTQTQEIVTVFEKMIKHNLLPSAIDFCIQMFWLTASLGCVGGALTALIAGKTSIKSDTKL